MSLGAQQGGTTTQTTAPYAGYQPYIGTALGQAGNLLGTGGPQYYPGQTVAPFNRVQNRAFNDIQNFAGGMLENGTGTNPYLDQMFNQAAQATQGQLASQFAGSGRNLDASMPLRSDQLNNLASNIYGGQYQNTINNQFNAAGMLSGLGNQIQGQTQNLIDANKAKYDYYQQLPYKNLQQFESFLSGVQPGSSTSSPYFTNPTAEGLGTALAGMQLYQGMQGMGGKGGAGGSGGIGSLASSGPISMPF